MALKILILWSVTMKFNFKFGNKKKQDSTFTEGIPVKLPASAHDIGNYLARYRLANFQIQAVMKLDGRLDYDKLVRAVRLSV